MGGVLQAVSGLSGTWAYVAVALLVCAESAAFVGLVIPGETALLLGGFLAFTGHADLPVMIVVAVIAAVVGDSVGYELGRLLGPALRRSRPGRWVGAGRWARAERHLTDCGGRAVFFGRWIGVLRALVPTLAGMSRLRYRTFLVFNAAGGAIWASTFVLLGYAAGGSYRRLEHVTGRVGLLLTLVLGLLVVLMLVHRWVGRRRRRVTGVPPAAGMRLPWTPFAPAIRDAGRRLSDRLRLAACRGWTLPAGAVAVTIALFGVAVEDVLQREGLVGLNQPIWRFVAGHRAAAVTDVMVAITALGSTVVLGPAAAVTGGWLAWRRRRWSPLLMTTVVVAGAALLGVGVKRAVATPRPPMTGALVGASGYGFPSGHTVAITAAVGALAYLVVRSRPRWPIRIAVIGPAVLLVAAVGVSRVYLGVHWASDVIGGWALAGGWLALVACGCMVHRQFRQPGLAAAGGPRRGNAITEDS